MQIRIYLAWQRIADGRGQIRRWSPDRTINKAQNRFVFMGFEAQNLQSLAWLTSNGEPTWPECIDVPLPKEPFCIMQDDVALSNWKPKNEDYVGVEPEPEQPDLIEGLNRFLKTVKGE